LTEAASEKRRNNPTQSEKAGIVKTKGKKKQIKGRDVSAAASAELAATRRGTTQTMALRKKTKNTVRQQQSRATNEIVGETIKDDAQYEAEYVQHHAQQAINHLQKTLNEHEGCLTTANLIRSAAMVFGVAHVAATHDFASAETIHDALHQFVHEVVAAGRKAVACAKTNAEQEAVWCGVTHALLELARRSAMETFNVEFRVRDEEAAAQALTTENLIQMPTSRAVN